MSTNLMQESNSDRPDHCRVQPQNGLTTTLFRFDEREGGAISIQVGGLPAEVPAPEPWPSFARWPSSFANSLRRTGSRAPIRFESVVDATGLEPVTSSV